MLYACLRDENNRQQPASTHWASPSLTLSCTLSQKAKALELSLFLKQGLDVVRVSAKREDNRLQHTASEVRNSITLSCTLLSRWDFTRWYQEIRTVVTSMASVYNTRHRHDDDTNFLIPPRTKAKGFEQDLVALHFGRIQKYALLQLQERIQFAFLSSNTKQKSKCLAAV